MLFLIYVRIDMETVLLEERMKINGEIYICEFNEESMSAAQYHFFYSHLPLFRRKQVNSYRHRIDKIQYTLSYSLFQYACIINKLNITSDELKCTRFGKPYFATLSRKYFNIANCRKAVCCAFSNHAVGVDISDCIKEIKDILKMSLCQNEIRRVCDDHTPEELFTWYWTLKESYLKYVGIGLNDRLDSLDFSQFEILTNFEAYQCKFMTKRIGNIFIASCAKETMHFKVVDLNVMQERISLENEKQMDYWK